MFAFKFVAEALGVQHEEGKKLWDQAAARLKRRNQKLPVTTREKPPGEKHPTPKLKADDAAKTLALVLKEPLEDFFEKSEKLSWLRSKVQQAGGDPKTVDAIVEELAMNKAQREADAQSLVLPGLQTEGDVALRTTREGEEVLGSVLDYLRWLGLSDASAEWHHWLSEEFRQHHVDEINAIIFVDKRLPNQSLSTPFTNFAGYRILAKLCLSRCIVNPEMYETTMKLAGIVPPDDPQLSEHLSAMNSVYAFRKQKPILSDDLYIMQYSFDATIVKIGRSCDVERRRKGLEASQNFKVQVARVFHRLGHMEKVIHHRLRKLRCTSGPGTEWFHLDACSACRIVAIHVLRGSLWRGALKKKAGFDMTSI